MERKHILICGERGAGKSTLIRNLIAELNVEVSGFVTEKRQIENTDTHGVYINPAVGERKYSKENMAGLCHGKKWDTYPRVFDEAGAKLIQADNGIIVMDELGFMEAKAEVFTQEVMAALDGSIPVIAAVKARKDVPFLNAVRTHPNCVCFTITAENREELMKQLGQTVKEWKL